MSDHNENDRSVRAAQGMQHKAQGVHARKSGQIDMSAVPSAAVELGHIFADAGYELALVGGSVRDILLGRPAHDLDFCTSAKPEEFEPLLRQWGDGFWDMGRKFGTLGALKHMQDGADVSIEVTT